MSGSTPRRRHPPAVYRRRRLVVGLIALAVVGIVVWILVAQPWRGLAATTGQEPSPSASPSTPAPEPEAPASPPAEPEAPPAEDTAAGPEGEPEGESVPAAEPCIAAALLVEAVTDKTAYGQGEHPQLSIRLTNRSESACTLNVGTSAQAFTITSGDDVWWRSTDCQVEPSDMIVLLEAGQQVSSATPVAWDRTRSTVDTCQASRPHAPGGGASYHLSVAIGGIASSNTAQFQLY